MTEYPLVIAEYWASRFRRKDPLHDDGAFTLSINPALSDKRRVMVLTKPDGRVSAVLTPGVLEQLNIPAVELTESAFRSALAAAGMKLHSPDLYFHFSEESKAALLRESDPPHVRHLTQADSSSFAEFQADAPEPDRDEAFVELDHWAVFGAFADGRLVSATSMYPWDDSRLADLGVLTVPSFRGKGYGRDVVRAISRYAHSQGYETQYRCQEANRASARLAESSGLTLFGRWEVIAQDA